MASAYAHTTGDLMYIGLGFDTGGTYTDAVILDMKNGTVLQKAKALTTKENLVIGIENAIKNFDQELLSNISIVSLSSTLATNSVVEGKGCRVGLICIGREYNNSVRVDEYIKVSGRHDLNGEITEELDIDSIKRFLNNVKDKIDCIAITGYMSVRNPEHEIDVEKLVKMTIDKPIVCGYQLSSSLGFNERTVTAIMNARLIPVIKDLIGSVSKVMDSHEIHAPIMIVKGDGSIMNVKMAEERPVETILCGPAASLTGAKVLTGIKDAVVVDMGGTTTDIGILRNGFPSINSCGATIGGHRTHVLAAEISTSGIGGDSRIFLNGNEVCLKPQRVVPLCIAAYEHPEIIGDLEETIKQPVTNHRAFDDRNVISNIEFFTGSKPLSTEILSQIDREFLGLIKQRPLTLNRAASILNVHPLNFNITKMEEHGLIQRIGLTPTDILHAEGSYVQYNAKASELGMEYMCRRTGTTKEEFIKKIRTMVYEKITREILMKVIFDETSNSKSCDICESIINKVITGNPGRDYDCTITLNKPIIGIGAPVCAWLPNVAKRLNTRFIEPHDSMVGNAIGAISGCIVESIDILIEPEGTCSDYSGPCTVFSKLGKMNFDTIQKGMEYARIEGGKFADTTAKQAGAYSTDVSFDVKERTYDIEGTKTILDILISVTATGKPQQMI
ncbi:MAG: hydantoinase/oxoprolinase family protein [Candidatus Methanogranum gryphiswaldense]|nr:MAG: hydantoinase/oxoprolinase family protein [Candidatus Methanogranum sp. U3.2.1]